MLGGLRRILVPSLVLLAGCDQQPSPEAAPTLETATMLDAPRPLPAVALTGHTGEPFAFEDLDGRHALVFFGFTNCPDVCPLTLKVLADSLKQIRHDHPEAVPAVVFVSVDPARDTPERIEAYLQGFDAEIIGATAPDHVLAPLLEALGVTVHKDERDGESYNVVHNGTVFVLDGSGRWIALFSGSSHRPETLIRDYLAISERG